MAGLKGVALVSLVELHSIDPAASHASLSGGDISKTVKGWRVASNSQVTSSLDLEQ